MDHAASPQPRTTVAPHRPAPHRPAPHRPAPHHPAPHHPEELCVVAPDPALKGRLDEQFRRLRESADEMLAPRLRFVEPRHPGFNDGMLFPGTYYPVGTTLEVARAAALERAPLRGTVRVIVVLVEFSDKAMDGNAVSRFRDLFFSSGVLPHGSVKEYFTDVSGGLITIDGDVVGPYALPHPLATYAGSQNGTQGTMPNARTMADDALTACDPDVGFAPYDNDGNGYVDAFIVVHAGSGAEQTGAASDIWSHKWVLPAERAVDGAKVFTYLTIPEDAKLGVSAHELGHLVFGWPDLYDTDYSSEGVGNWCLMGGGSWGLDGDRPTHPSAWCKANQGWATVVNHTSNGYVTVEDVKSSRTVHRLWKDGAGGNEFFLLENRMQTGYDASLPGQGLLVWHIDEAVSTNKEETHYKVALVQADNRKDLEHNANRGDDGDSYPGSGGNTVFSDSSTPNSRSYAGSSTNVSVTEIPSPSASMRVRIGVRPLVLKPPKDVKELTKEGFKEVRDKGLKDRIDVAKPLQDKQLTKENLPKELREGGKPPDGKLPDGKLPEGKLADGKLPDVPGPGWPGAALPDVPGGGSSSELEARLAVLESLVASLLAGQSRAGTASTSHPTATEPFIESSDRPDLGAAAEPDADELRTGMASGSAEAKRLYDTLPPR